jgi:hypothetical protein
MNIPEYNTELDNNLVSNLANITPGSNESSLSIFDYLYDSTDNNINDNVNHTGGPQHLATILQQLFSKMSDNQTIFNIPSSSSLSSASSTGILSQSLPASSNDPNSHNLLSTISFWFVLIVNPIVVKKNLFKCFSKQIFLDFIWCHWESSCYIYFNQWKCC